MIILAIDSANFSTSVALQEGKKILAYAENRTTHAGDTILLPMIESLFKGISLSIQDITHIAVTLGPGSFTGTRVGIASARGLSLALEVPILAVNSFEWVAHSYNRKNSIDASLLVALESKREESFVSLFSPELKVLREATYLRPDQLSEYIGTHRPVMTGNAAPYFCTGQDSWMPDAQDLALYVQEKLAGGTSFEPCIPFYLRPPEISFAKK